MLNKHSGCEWGFYFCRTVITVNISHSIMCFIQYITFGFESYKIIFAKSWLDCLTPCLASEHGCAMRERCLYLSEAQQLSLLLTAHQRLNNACLVLWGFNYLRLHLISIRFQWETINKCCNLPSTKLFLMGSDRGRQLSSRLQGPVPRSSAVEI